MILNPYEDYALRGCPDPVCPRCGREAPDLVEIPGYEYGLCFRCAVALDLLETEETKE